MEFDEPPPLPPPNLNSLTKSFVHSDNILKLYFEIENESRGISHTASKQKTQPKNYLKENFKRLKDIQNRVKQNNSEKQPLQPLKAFNKYSQVQSKVSSTFKETNCIGDKTNKNDLPKTAGPYRNCPPRSPRLSAKSDSHKPLQPYKSLPQLNHLPEIDQVSTCQAKALKNEYNFDENKLPSSASSSIKMKHRSKSEVPHPLGQVPTYLIERKKRWEEEKERQLKLLEEANIPEGHTLLSDEERIETLELLKRNKEELMQNLAMLPVRNDTLRLRNYRDDLERQLAKVEEGIKIFSRPKVLIKNDS